MNKLSEINKIVNFISVSTSVTFVWRQITIFMTSMKINIWLGNFICEKRLTIIRQEPKKIQTRNCLRFFPRKVFIFLIEKYNFCAP